MKTIEDKTHDGKVPRKLSGPCPSCKTETDFIYKGRTTGSIRTEPVDLYDCNGCKSTLALNTLVNKYGATYDQNDLIDACSLRLSIWNRAKKLIIKGIYSI